MILLIQTELAVALIASLIFAGLYAGRSRWRESAVGRHMVIFALVLGGAFGALLAASLRVPVPIWCFVVGFGLVDALLIQQIILLVRIQEGRQP